MIQISPQQARNRRCGEELDVLATIVAAMKAGLALEAGDIRLDCDPVARFEGCDGGMDREDDPC
jgi:hypothetical protein